ncbi:MAG TPA: hypothetical protein VG672_09755 [Bryobacteraceae bacterium]|nr:hypothetical protein [Bryobacteraceae bacterium]
MSFHHVPFAAPRSNEVFPELPAHVGNMHIDKIGESVAGFIEQMVINHGARDQLATVHREKLDQCVFAQREEDDIAGLADEMFGSVDGYVADLDDGAGLSGTAADEGAQAGVDFAQLKRFAEVIVKAGVEAFDVVGERVAGHENEHSGFPRFVEARAGALSRSCREA